MKVFAWHVHGSWMTAFVQGGHEYLVPVLAGRGAHGRGLARTYAWPKSVEEVTLEEAAELEVDVAVLQRPEELELAARLYAAAARNAPNLAERDHQTRQAARLNQLLRGPS